MFTKDDLIFSYTRKEAIEDGIQIETPGTICKNNGLKIPVFMTSTVYEKYVKVPESLKSVCDEQSRFAEILLSLYKNILKNTDVSTLFFDILVLNDKNKTEKITLKSMIGAKDIDDPSPAITICLKNED
jgi:hypothetical protein